VKLYHCKYSSADTPGARISDFYEVCGQAQKCVQWRENPRRMLQHLLHQEGLRTRAGKASRFERGSRATVQNLINKGRRLAFDFEVIIVQPGFKRSSIAPQFLDVLGATEVFLKETFSIPLGVVVSD
ncbi:MAG: helicase, partial [Methylocystis sp.]